ncbi:MAG: DUF3667 domain-containing protein [Lysobacter sp.]|nr:DUF3667 domain-containing protein [Lysobacter sp.]
MNDHHATRCANCETPLVGPHCHICGQHAHNPLRSFAHAVEDVFESFWHLDGRIFRTLRDLCVPGRLAANFLDGRRTAYLPPLRLFVILSLLTFFIGKLTLHIDLAPAPQGAQGTQPTPGATAAAAASRATTTAATAARRGGSVQVDTRAIEAATTPDAVLAARDAQLADMQEARRIPVVGSFVDVYTQEAEAQLLASARQRMQAIGATPAQVAAAGDAATARLGKQPPAIPDPSGGALSGWWQGKLDRMQRNAEDIRKDPNTLIPLFLGALPGALFVLVPLFALCLKLLYLGSGRGYLEHLVVALYSHCFMLVALLASFLLVGLQAIAGLPGWIAVLAALAASLDLGVLVPVYLLLMQKRVYAEGWPLTLLKYFIVGTIYSALLGIAIVYAILAGLTS